MNGTSEAPQLQETKSDAVSPDGRYILAESKPSGTLETEPGKEKVSFETGDKRGSETVFESPVKPAGTLSYVSPRGTRFQLEKLERPVINDNNRKIDSGDWKVIISGGGDEYLSLKEKLGQPSFGDTGKTEYYGSLELAAEGR